jgi:hypothetical protein
MTFSAGSYFAFPLGTLHSTVVVFRGVGIRRETSVALSFESKTALTVIVYETLAVPFSTTVGRTLMGKFMDEVERYLWKMSVAATERNRTPTSLIQTLHLGG